jgi:hypothetical protein
MSAEYWEDVIPDRDEDGDEAYMSFFDRLHEFEPGERDPKWGTYKCIRKMYRRDGTEYICNGSSHDSMHEPIEGCCHCKHGVYLHTSYDIPCGRCEMGDDE